ncbi:MAG: DUF2147 domain-containing protein [Pseudomonadota bacterium]
MKNSLFPSAVIGILLAVFAVPALAEDLGVWRNQSNSVHVEVFECGEARCGKVVWASEKAKQDAVQGGTARLVGTQVLRKFREKGDSGKWKGKAFVADMNREFSGTARAVDYNTIEVKGCIAGGLICKTQIWTRVK